MPIMRDNTVRRFDALNNWLGDVYDKGTCFSTLLIDGGFSETEIEYIKQVHLNEFLQAVIDLLATYREQYNQHRDIVMVTYYGLGDGEPQDYYTIAPSVGVCGERIRQLVNRSLVVFRHPKRQALFKKDFVIGQRLLNSQSRSLA